MGRVWAGRQPRSTAAQAAEKAPSSPTAAVSRPGIVAAGATRHDSPLLKPTLNAADPPGQNPLPMGL
ncbi:hypothetical protein GCM10010170_004650 [Dactylosporangium salmoneum]|uniref:Uncharacterized protein n=1 Tax=Dactylosporangium salmoneum TaxID=53361 RepID=A0ABN3FE24_9ACTN